MNDKKTEQFVFVKEVSGWAAFCMKHPGILSQGKTLSRAQKNMRAIFFDILEHGELNLFYCEKNLHLINKPKELVADIYGENYNEWVLKIAIDEIEY